MKTFSVISHKGGAGRTSTAVMLAEDLAARGCRVVLVDADRQRGAGLVLNVSQKGDKVQPTRHGRLRYFCSSDLRPEELPPRVAQLAPFTDIAVVDTPSLDDPLARGWLQLSTGALLVLPVEPISIRTLPGAARAFEEARRTNPGLCFLGMLPTLFDGEDPSQQKLLAELHARYPGRVLSPPIAHDSCLSRYAAEEPGSRTDPLPVTRDAYAAAADHILRCLQIDLAPSGPTAAAASANAAAVLEANAPWVGAREPGIREKLAGLRLAFSTVAALMVLTLCLGVGLGWVLGYRARAAGTPFRVDSALLTGARP